MFYFTSDTHFFHKRVIEYCQRPYASIEEMHEALIKNWNDRVTASDDIYVLGDFVFGGVKKCTDILARLNGHKHLIIGNHDHHSAAKYVTMGFETAVPTDTVVLGRQSFTLSHFPFRGQAHDERQFTTQLEDDGVTLLLHGHVHCNWKRSGRMLNVGCDQWNYAPVSRDEILEVMK